MFKFSQQSKRVRHSFKKQRSLNLQERYVLFVVLPIIVTLVHALWSKFYSGIAVEEIYSYRFLDKPPLPLTEVTTSIRGHYFGDYAMNYWISKSQNFSLENIYPSPWLPVAYLFFIPFHPFAYETGLYLFLTVCCLSIIAASIHATRRFNINERVLIVAIGVMATLPVLSGIDRGNTSLLIIPTVYFFLYSNKTNKPKTTALCLALAVALKPHAFILITLLVITRKWATVVKAIIATSLIQIWGWVLVWDHPVSRMSQILETMNDIASQQVFHSSFSLNAFVPALFGQFNFSLEKNVFELRTITSIAALCIIVSISLNKKVPYSRSVLLICGSIPATLPVSPPYTLAFVLAASLYLLSTADIDQCDNSIRTFDWLFMSCSLVGSSFIFQSGVTVGMLFFQLAFIFLILDSVRLIFSKEKSRDLGQNRGALVTFVIPALTLGMSFLPITTEIYREFSHSQKTSTPTQAPELKKICKYLTDSSEVHQVLITFAVKENPNVLKYSNAFQTDDQNLGIRVERDPSGAVSLVVPQTNGKLTGIAVPLDPSIRAYLGKIRLTSTGQVVMSINGIVSRNLLPPFAPTCDNPLIGTGYSSERSINGTTHLDIQVIDSKAHEFVKAVRILILFFLLCGIIALTLNLARTRQNFDEKSN